MRSVGTEVPLESLYRKEYVSNRRGSSASDLVAAARDFGQPAVAMTGLTFDDLKRLNAPAILYKRSNRLADSQTHWIAFLGEEDGEILIVDSGVSETLSEAELCSLWDGVAVVLVSKSEALSSVVLSTSILIAKATLAVLVCALFLRGMRSWITRPSLRRAQGRRSWPAFSLICGCLFAFSALADLAGSRSLLRHPAIASTIVMRNSAVDFEEVSKFELEKYIATSPHAITIVDTRRGADYSRGKIGDAIHIPAVCPGIIREKMIGRIPPETLVIVYCQSARCEYADDVAKSIMSAGLENVVIYRGGYRDWVS